MSKSRPGALPNLPWSSVFLVPPAFPQNQDNPSVCNCYDLGRVTPF